MKKIALFVLAQIMREWYTIFMWYIEYVWKGDTTNEGKTDVAKQPRKGSFLDE